MDWTLTLTQADGSQLGYDEQGIPSGYATWFVFYIIALSVHVWAHYMRAPKFAPAIVRLYSLSLVLQTASLFCHACDWLTVASRGTGVPFFSILGSLLRVLAAISLWVLAALVANGYGVRTFAIDERANYASAALTLCALGAGCGFIGWNVTRDPANPERFTSAPALIVLLLLTFVFVAWFLVRLSWTLKAEAHTVKKALLFRLGAVLLGNFAILPFSEFVGGVTPVALALRVTLGFDLFLVACVQLALGIVLWPSRAADAFSVYDGSSEGGLLGLDELGGVKLEDGAGGVYAALDENDPVYGGGGAGEVAYVPSSEFAKTGYGNLL